ncbi:MAG: RNA polymerase sigma factor [Myxococcota bacterium]
MSEPLRPKASPRVSRAASVEAPNSEAPGPSSGFSVAEPPDLTTLFERYASYVGAVALRLLGRPGEVDDVVQEVFMAAQHGLRHAESEPAVKAWLAKVTVRTAQRRLRTLRAKGFFGVGSEPAYESVVDHSASPEQRALVADIYAALDRMAPRNRVAWVLRYVEGHRLEEVARLCNCSLATAKRRIAAARDRLRDEFGVE